MGEEGGRCLDPGQELKEGAGPQERVCGAGKAINKGISRAAASQRVEERFARAPPLGGAGGGGSGCDGGELLQLGCGGAHGLL